MTNTRPINGYKVHGCVLIPNSTGPRKAFILKAGYLAHPVTTFWGKNANVARLLPYLLKTTYTTFAKRAVFRKPNPRPDASGFATVSYRQTIWPTIQTYQLTSHSSHGCYPLYYVTADNGCLCAKCATEQATHRALDWPRIVDVQPYYEGAPIECDNCNAQIESAYGEPTGPIG